MPVNKDSSGRRSVHVEVEVPGTPEQVWRAIATSSGISSWFVPTTSENDVNGVPVRITSNFGPGMESSAMGEQVLLSIRVHLYGSTAGSVAAREEPAWQAWLGETFPVLRRMSAT